MPVSGCGYQTRGTRQRAESRRKLRPNSDRARRTPAGAEARGFAAYLIPRKMGGRLATPGLRKEQTQVPFDPLRQGELVGARLSTSKTSRTPLGTDSDRSLVVSHVPSRDWATVLCPLRGRGRRMTAKRARQVSSRLCRVLNFQEKWVGGLRHVPRLTPWGYHLLPATRAMLEPGLLWGRDSGA